MKQFAIIGLGNFGVRVLEEMLQLNVEVMVIDRDSELIEEYKDRVAAAYVVDAIKEDLIRKVVPDTIDAAIVDLGHTTEASILCTNYLAKMGIARVIAKAETDQHGISEPVLVEQRVRNRNLLFAAEFLPLLAESKRNPFRKDTAAVSGPGQWGNDPAGGRHGFTPFAIHQQKNRFPAPAGDFPPADRGIVIQEESHPAHVQIDNEFSFHLTHPADCGVVRNRANGRARR